MAEKIFVHEKALAHLSRGLYRSPASALRELVSNAWDANARTVRISTNYPQFFQITIDDDGDGFSKKEFERLMKGNIGNSEKRPSNKTLINNRPVIGRLGIGMLGIAQICGSFKVSSVPKEGDPFTAKVRLYDLLRKKLDAESKEIVKKDLDADNTPITEVDVGEYTFEDDALYKGRSHGTRITSGDVHPTFCDSFRKSVTTEDFEEPSLDWKESIKTMSSVHSLQQLGDYWKLLWELAVSCPIPYVSGEAVPGRAIADVHEQLQTYNFRILVDNIQLAKPVLLKGNPGGYTKVKIGPESHKIYGRDLKFNGYIVVQEGRQLKPDELRGILIRIKNVAIGYYDASMLDYRFNEGPRSRWVTGEIFVTEGLEDALNIDRDSFNRFHPEFRRVQEVVHRVLRNEVFPSVYKNIEHRSLEKQEHRREERQELLFEALSSSVEQRVRIREKPLQDDEKLSEVRETGSGIEVTLAPAETVKTKKAYRELATAISAIYELSATKRDANERRRMFSALLLQLLKHW
jgi:hypothetical protein